MTEERWREIDRVCQAALAVDAQQRAAVLDELCGGDAGLRREVESLLAEQSRDHSLLAAPAWQDVADALADDAARVPAPALSVGARLGPYEVIGPLGAGGMGEVYKARDTRLDRTVAIKVLPTEAAADPERRRRFEQEARAVSALNHPHICALFDVGEHVPSGPLPLAPVHYLVMEYLEGQTLAHRLRKGPMALEQALALGAQIAEALSAAHKLGIVHRDLKPANVMLTKASGALQAKLLDFGLARRSAANTQFRAGLSALSTEGPATTPGAVMGTVPYMAPEQLEGKAADARTDLFAFGCVLYEMLTGRRAFPGDSEASVISAIMTSEPAPLRSLQPVAPPALERLVTACLAKDPDERRQSAHDVADDLRGIAQGAPASSRAPARRRRDWLLGAAPSLIVVLAGALGWAAWQAWWRPAAVPVRADIAMPGGTQFAGTYVGVAFAPNGNGLVYRAADSAGSRFYWQQLDGSPPQVVPGTEQGAQPFFSPDAKHLGFTQRSKLVTLALPAGPPGDGGPIEPLADVGGMRGASWGEDGTILYTPRPLDGLWRVSANGGDARELTRPDPAKSEMSHRWPSFLPGGRAALFTILHLSGRQDRSAIGVLSLDTGRWTRIIDRGTRARYLPTGHVVYACKGALLAVRFDIKTLATIGRPTQVAKGVEMEWSGAAGDAWFDVSQSGALVFAPESYVPTNRSLVWLDRRGQVDPVTGDQRAYSMNLALSPDGQTLAGSAYEQGDEHLWLYHVPERRWQQLTSDADEINPIWSPNGDRLAFSSDRDGPFNLYVLRPDGESRAERLTHAPNWQLPYSWSPDGRFLAYQEQEGNSWNTWILPLDGDRKPWRWGPQGKNVTVPAFSPDGRWVAYQSQETGENFEVHVRPFPGPGSRQTVSGPDGGCGPVWSQDGREIMYLAGADSDNRILAVDVSPGPPLRFTNPHVAFAFPFAPVSAATVVRLRVFALAPDGRRLVTVRPDPRPAGEIHSLTLIRNWAEEVKAKVLAQR